MYGESRKPSFERDLTTSTVGDPVLRNRAERRIRKLLDNPKHHGYHAGGRIRCAWVAGVGDWAIIFDLDEEKRVVTMLRIIDLNDL